MNLYDLPKFNLTKTKSTTSRISSKRGKQKSIFSFIVLIIFASSVFGFFAGASASVYFYYQIRDYLTKINVLPQIVDNEVIEKEIMGYSPQTSQEEAIINVVKDASPAVVSIIITKDLPIFEEYLYDPFKEFEDFFGPTPPEFKVPQIRQKGTEKKEIGGGTGFIVSQDGLILTNKHVVLDDEADYTVFTNDGRKFSARVLARDPFQDLAVLKIEQETTVDDNGGFVSKPFPVVKLGDSDGLQSGQTVVAIGNALGEFRNTVSVGAISGLGRKITASGGSFVETLEDVIQTDAAINKGNSGGPLLNLKGEVIGINTAVALEAQSIGFAIPINQAKRDIEQIKNSGKIVYPFLGIRYVLVNEKVQEENNLPVDYGAFIIEGDLGEPAVEPGSAAANAGLRAGDIVLEFDNEKITLENTLAKIIMKYNPGDRVFSKVLRGEEEMIVEVELGERSE